VGDVPILFMPNLRTLILDCNDITELKFQHEKQLIPNLTEISIEKNPMVRSRRQTSFLKVLVIEEDRSEKTHTNSVGGNSEICGCDK
jgi:Leucine-rich repeat (LRR) protein